MAGPSSSSSASSSSVAGSLANNKTLLGVAIAGAAAVGAAAIYLLVRRSKSAPVSSTADQAATGASPNTSASESKIADPEEKLSSDIDEVMKFITNTQQLPKPQDIDKIKSQLRNLNLNSASPQIRIKGTQFLSVIGALNLVSQEHREEAKEAEKLQMPDMALAIKLLDFHSTQESENRRRDILLLDVSQRMRNLESIQQAYQRVYRRKESWTDDELVAAFLAAPLLGRWEEFKQIAETVVKSQHRLYDPEQGFQFPEHETLLKLGRDLSNVDSSELVFDSYSVESINLRFQGGSCSDPAEEQKFSQVPREWEEIPLPDGIELVRTGAMAQMITPGQMPIPMVGPMTSSTLKMEGFVRQGKQQQTVGYDLKKDSTSSNSQDRLSWSGTSMIKYEEIGENNFTEMFFEVKMTIRPSSSSS